MFGLSDQQIIIIISNVGATIAFALSHIKIMKGWKIFFSFLFLLCIITSLIVNLHYLRKKEAKEAEFEIKINQIDTNVKASLTFNDYIQAADLNRKAGRIDEAIYDVERALEKEPKSAMALNLLGVLDIDKGDYDNAIETFEKLKKGKADSSIVIGKGEYIFHGNFGEAYLRKKMWKEAKEEFTQCLSLNDRDLSCYIKLATTLDELNDIQGEYDVCKKGTTVFPNSASLHACVGKACINMSRLDEAESSFLQAIRVDSTFGPPYMLLGVIYFHRKQSEKSARLVEKALNLDSSLVESVKILRTKKLLP
jgi:tetratricopeptide (TPR) repeat protein